MTTAECTAPPKHCLVALGGNVGDVAATFVAALTALEQHKFTVLCVSRVFRSHAEVAVGAPAQADYLNAACLLATPFAPLSTLHRLQAVERLAGRRIAGSKGPRALDLDLLAYESFYQARAELTVPHPRAHSRSFVLLPACDIAADWPLWPFCGTFGQALAKLSRPPPDVVAQWLSWKEAKL